MSEPVETAMHTAGIGPKLKAALEYSPIIGFVAVYLVVREQSYSFWGRDRDGFVVLVGGFVPVVLALAVANEAVWRNFSTDVWVAYDTFVMPAAFLAIWL